MSETQSHNEASLLQGLATEGLHSNNLFRLSVTMGRFLIHRGPAEWVLEHIPSPVRDSIRSLVAKGFRRTGDRFVIDEKSLQQTMNGKLFISGMDAKTDSPTLYETNPQTLSSYFPLGKEAEWPRQMVFCTRDILPDPIFMSKRMHHFPKLVSQLLGQDVAMADDLAGPVAGKTLVVGAYHTGNTILHNGADVLERTLILRKQPNSLQGISPAAMLMGQSILDLMTLQKHDGITLLRPDTEALFRHITLHGFSQGGNITTDAFRYMRHELKSGRYSLALDTQATQSIPIHDDQTIGRLFSGAYILNIAGVDVPYTGPELGVLPPRDNVRSDGDVVVSGAVGVNRQQSNYNYRWEQDAPNPQRQDRLLETIGPVGRPGKQASPDDRSYLSYLGHNEKHYWNHALLQVREPLAERLNARFTGQSVASDITFSGDTLQLKFERGTLPHDASANRQKFLDILKRQAEITPLAPAAYSPYDVTLSVPPTPQALHAISSALRESGILTSREVAEALDPQLSLGMIAPLAQRIPGTETAIGYGRTGPFVALNRAEGFGERVAGLLQKDLKILGIEGKHRPEPDGKSIHIPIEDVLAAIDHAPRKAAVQQR